MFMTGKSGPLHLKHCLIIIDANYEVRLRTWMLFLFNRGYFLQELDVTGSDRSKAPSAYTTLCPLDGLRPLVISPIVREASFPVNSNTVVGLLLLS